MDKERLRRVLEELRERYEEEWNSIKGQIFEKIAELKDLVKKESLEEYIDRIAEVVRDLHGKIFFWWVQDPEGLRKILSLQEVKELLNLAEEMKDLTQMQLIEEKLRNAITVSAGAGITTLSSWLSVFNHKFFMPTWRGTINSDFRNNFGIREFYLTRDIKNFVKFTKTVKEVANELGIDNMIEVAFYLSKFGHPNKQFLEKIGEEFLRRCADRGISEVQLEDTKSYYKKLYLPSNIHETIRKYIHLEWIFRSGKLCVGVHIEVPRDVNKNDKIMNIILNDSESKFEELASDVNSELEILRNLSVFRWIHISKPYSDLNEGLKEWAVDTMLKLYNIAVPIIKRRQAEIMNVIGVIEIDPILKSKIDQILNNKKQVILYGPPGTGKTWTAQAYIEEVLKGQEKDRSKFITFHPSYSYEEFVEGLKPIPAEATTSGLKFIVEDGIFKRIAIRAICEALKSAENLKNIAEELLNSLKEIENGNLNEYDRYLKKKRELWNRIKELSKDNINELFENAPKFYLVIDEINRGDISRIFGELITLLEADKRLREDNQIIVTLPYSKEPFGVPPNLFIIGTMNTADRSIALIDIALRRRFGFIELMPSYKVLINKLGIGNVNNEDDATRMIESWNENDLNDVKKLAVKVLYSINKRIRVLYDRDHQIGHSYLLKLKDSENIVKTLEYIWYHEIIPLLQEYFYDSPEKLGQVLNGKFVKEEKIGDKTIYEFVEERDFINALKGVVKEGES